MPQLFIFGLSISRAPLQASTSSSWASSGKPSRARNSSSFHEPRRIFRLPARHCELNGAKRVSLSPLSEAGVTVKLLSARTRWNAWLLPACPGSWPNPTPACRPARRYLSTSFSVSPGFDLPKQIVVGPGQVLDLGDQLRPHPMHAAEHQGESRSGWGAAA